MTARWLSRRYLSTRWMVVSCCLLVCALSMLFLGGDLHTAQAASVPTFTSQAGPAVSITHGQEERIRAFPKRPFSFWYFSAPASLSFSQAGKESTTYVVPSVYWRDGQPMQRVQPLSWCSGPLKGKFC